MFSYFFDYSSEEIHLPLNASWNQSGITVAGSVNGISSSSTTYLKEPVGLSISNDILYVADTGKNRIVVVDLNDNKNNFTIGCDADLSPSCFKSPNDVVVTNTFLYVLDNGNHRVVKLSLNGSGATTVFNYGSPRFAWYFYVDPDDNIYLSDVNKHEVLLYCSNSRNSTRVAGNGFGGPQNNLLDNPNGVFVNRIGDIYIADFGNNRIMKWKIGGLFGNLVAGGGTGGGEGTQLYKPSYITLDADEYMYISDFGNNRITRWAPNASVGVCIVACTGQAGTTQTHFNNPAGFAFDSNGSLYVSDWQNHRVQKFQILRNQSMYLHSIDHSAYFSLVLLARK